ncbi:MAG: DNA double-strand break repair nuclease NurA [Candidatus Thorarchaeota archaeon]
MNRDLDRMLSRLVEEIERIEQTRSKFGQVMQQIKSEIDLGRFPAVAADTAGPEFVKKIEPVALSGLRIAGIDGGLVRRRFRSMDLLLTRGVAVIFHFGPKEGPRVDFYPDPFPPPAPKFISLVLSTQELDQIASLERVATELKITISVLDEFHVDLILVDGSLFYHPRDRPAVGSPAHEKFQEVIALYKQLYHKATRQRTVLVGIIKDSRSTRVVNTLGDIFPHILRDPSTFELMQGIDYRWLLKMSRDCDLLDTFLEEGERTFAFRYSSELTQASNSIDDIVGWASSIWVTYIKTAREDLPLRVEVLAKDDPRSIEIVDRALATILPLSSHHPEYGIPTPILEADARARISNNETQFVVDRLMAISGLTYTSLEKRRSRNPFGGL